MRCHLRFFVTPGFAALFGALLATLLAALVHGPAHAARVAPATQATRATQATQVGWRQITLPSAAREVVPPVVALFYATTSTARSVPMGPFSINAAIQAPPEDHVNGLILLSHGTAGSELGHSSLAQALAQSGYLVVALRHPGDNWQDTSLRDGLGAGNAGGCYFVQRPRQVAQVIDALLQDPLWKDRIASNRHGPRIGVVGRSGGGYTVLALAGGQPDLARLAAHCTTHPADDPIVCSIARRSAPTTPVLADAASPALAPQASTDARVRAVVALAPAGALFTAASLARITVPTLLYRAEEDHFLVPRFHVGWIAQNMAQAQVVGVATAWHFVFMDPPNMVLPSPDGDVGANPAGFDRAAFLAQLGADLPQFFERAWQ